jgi:hypothetical protein
MGAEMESNGSRSQGANASGSEVPGEAQAAPAMAGRPRPAWAKPVIYQFSLKRTMAGSGLFSDASKLTSALAT